MAFYYNKFYGRVVFDTVDTFLLGIFIMSIVAQYLKKYVSDNASMRRLRNDTIKKSRLIEPSKEPSKSAKNLSFKPKRKQTKLKPKQTKLQKIHKIAFDTRGGSEYEEYKLAEKIQHLVISLAFYLKTKEQKAKVLKFMFKYGRVLLKLFLAKFNIKLEYILINPISDDVAIVAFCAGGTVGFVTSWLSVGGTVLFAPTTIISGMILRSIFQQTIHDVEYNRFIKNVTKLKTKVTKLLLDEDAKQELTDLIRDTQNQTKNSKAITIEELNWNKNPAIKEAAERLGIFENPPNANVPIKLDSNRMEKLKKLGVFDSDQMTKFEEQLEELGVIENPIPEKITKFRKGKTVYFRDFINERVDNNVDLDLDLHFDSDFDLNVKPVEEPLRIKD